MVEEEKHVYLVTKDTEMPISCKEAMVSIIVIMHKAGPTMGHWRTTLGITTMSLQVTKDTDRMSERW